jgi:hypothetical protein
MFSSFLSVSRPAVVVVASRVSQDIGTQVRSAQKSYRKIDKPPVCNLDVGKYHLVSQPEGEINPKVCDARHRIYVFIGIQQMKR